ncbi:DUF3500 domain-containing protein [Rhizobium bangladeshense]|uniref:DUF3500 domain-containing protein n=1 Tax=Rhizobium bangladeshense TaxID=1138189 RepID=UPI001C8389C5|nr:DUF3500 domain-containing protein [Rhizobium bangladeshense]MBX4898714.1 DUF3500 domain-containing protein [Rhizobium bangladeshense]MBY3616737.1 DUF3500 domain-containing protein [Rhizobium bangladeshense]
MNRIGLILAFLPLLIPGASLARDGLQTPLREEVTVRNGDARSLAIVEAAESLVRSFSDEQRARAIAAFSDNEKRQNWSNLPVGMYPRHGIARGALSEDQRAALDRLLGVVLSEAGMRNVAYQIAADDTLGDGGMEYGGDNYYVAFLGEPSSSRPWMLQFGGHHLALNVTAVGPDISFSPMLTGGQPLNITFDGEETFITRQETEAAQAFLDSLTDEQRKTAIRGDRPINLLLGPGNYGAMVAPEGIRGADLRVDQKSRLVEVIAARIGFMNDDSHAATLETVMSQLNDTYFAWWGPVGTLGAAYFRVTAPSLVMEYAPQLRGGDPTDHSHNIYRDPTNDYGMAWVGQP